MHQPRQDTRVVTPVVAVSATFTAELLEAPLRFWIDELGWDYRVRFAPYNQVFQQLLDPESLLARNRDGVNVILVRFEDWSRFGSAGPAALEENVRQLIAGLTSAAAAWPSPLLVTVCPASPAFLEDPERAALAKSMEALLCSSLQGTSGLYWIGPTELAALYPVAESYDPHGDQLGHIPYTPAFFAALTTLLARKINALRMPPYKVAVLDCDETLWSGVCAEDGPAGVVLDPARRFLQEFMRARRDEGLLLALCSKNDDADIVETFRANPHFPLRLEDFTARRINWEPKSDNLVSLAEELNLGLDSFIFLDDNHTECAELQAHCPDVLTLPLPAQPGEIPAFLSHVWAFDRLAATSEDRRRAALYAQEVERSRVAKKSASLEEFLTALNLEIRIAPMTPEQLPRVSQLTLRTNQMNFTGLRRSESEIQALLRDGRAECLTVDVRDRFGGYGLVGVMIFETGPRALVLDTFLLSCRALGRGVEHRMLARLGEIALERGLPSVEARFSPTARNSPALKLLHSAAAERVDSGAAIMVFHFSSEALARLRYRPNGAKPAVSPPPPAAAEQPARDAVDFLRIATELATVAQVQEQIAARKLRDRASVQPSAAPRTEIEHRLAAIWAELLAVPTIGVDDDFFDLGGHSLLAVQLLSRVRQEFQVDLSLEVVYSGPFTVAELAKAIDLGEIERSGADYASILQEIQNLSDEEARALLAAEEQAHPD
jgi:FkbH-like protein